MKFRGGYSIHLKVDFTYPSEPCTDLKSLRKVLCFTEVWCLGFKAAVTVNSKKTVDNDLPCAWRFSQKIVCAVV